MFEIIVADHQELYGAGIVALLSASGYRPILQLFDRMRLHDALVSNANALLVVSTTLVPDSRFLLEDSLGTNQRMLLIVEDYESLLRYRSMGFGHVVHRSVSSTVFLERVRRIRNEDPHQLPAERKVRPAGAISGLATRLTPSEQVVLALLMEGKKNRIIADRLKIEEHVVRGKLQKIYQKMGFSTRLELVMYLAGQQVPLTFAIDAVRQYRS